MCIFLELDQLFPPSKGQQPPSASHLHLKSIDEYRILSGYVYCSHSLPSVCSAHLTRAKVQQHKNNDLSFVHCPTTQPSPLSERRSFTSKIHRRILPSRVVGVLLLGPMFVSCQDKTN